MVRLTRNDHRSAAVSNSEIVPMPVRCADAETHWQESLRQAIRSPEELLRAVGLDPDRVAAYQPSAREFPMLVPRSFVARMRRGDPQDPLLLQVLPNPAERTPVPGFTLDALDELSVARNGVLTKYSGRALLIATGTCPIHCRYCFRRNFPYAQQLAARRRWAPAIAELQRDPGIREVILSGGDPLALTNSGIATLMERIESLSSVQTLRIHTRFPIILPERVDQRLLDVLSATRLKTVAVVHCNHANEVNGPVKSALLELRDATTLLLNQSVLLNGINDDADQLERLSWTLFDSGALPYYLHLPDPVAGTAHFHLREARGRQLIDTLRARLPGYLVPRLVREMPGRPGKTIIG